MSENKWTSLPSAYIEFMAKQSKVSRVFRHSDLLGIEVRLNEHEAMKEALRLRELDEEEHTRLGRMKFMYAAYSVRAERVVVRGVRDVQEAVAEGWTGTVEPRHAEPDRAQHDRLSVLDEGVRGVHAVREQQERPVGGGRAVAAVLHNTAHMTGDDDYNKKTFDLALGLMQCVGPLLLVYQAFVYSDKGKKKQRKVGGDLDEVRMMAKSIAEERKSAKEVEGRGSGAGRFLSTVSGGVGLGSGFSRKNEGGRQWADEDLTARRHRRHRRGTTTCSRTGRHRLLRRSR